MDDKLKNIIIIPYRDRESHLKYFLDNSYPKIQNITPNLEIIIVEQTNGKKFNRGLTINIGYHYYNNENYYYITHDVDTNPVNDYALNMYKKELKEKEVYSIYSNEITLGGCLKIKGSDFKRINGFPNDFWGWGCEDRDILNRCIYYNYSIIRGIGAYSKDSTKYFYRLSDNHVRQPNDKHNFAYQYWTNLPKEKKHEYISSNGLSTMNYKILKDELIQEGVRKILVEI